MPASTRHPDAHRGLTRSLGVVVLVLMTLLTGTSAASAAETFPITGAVDGLAPGVTRSLLLTVDNPFDFEITVTELSATAESADAGCGAANLTVEPFEGSLPVAANASAHQPLAVTMAPDAPPACEDAIWPLAFSGSAVAADGSLIGGEGRLAFTGASPTRLDLIAAALVGLGLLVLVATRRRRLRTAR